MDDTDRHPVTELLGAYYMDALPIEQGDEIERHLAGCVRCRETADEVIELVATLALVEGDGRREVIDEFGAVPSQKPAGAAPEVVPVVSEKRPEERPAVRNVRPARETRDRTRPPRSRRRRALVLTGALFAVAVLAAGLAGVALLRGLTGSPADGYETVAATGREGAASLSVVVSEQEQGGALVEATVSGLTAGTGYRLYATVAGGEIVLVASWADTGEVQDLSGRLDGEIGEIVSFTVTGPGGGAVVTADFRTATSSTPPR
ncbi:putative anti-sigma-YlaC factor YlaD [Catenuloplanes nepalensis]|uniref:Anti-sigma-YlaC factor YlaD n=1 Tax=Catenuloplanes nepalensis TaxID=587533 RepID=A0ABT9MXP1_9ACTN|nr:zf-HC2 domain-containing protein [Catenuloplanes nepalensis]MDP9796195.1 putative anti-sigma-YlaC factor YlaD [Catenuloplanes nepalensis]